MHGDKKQNLTQTTQQNHMSKCIDRTNELQTGTQLVSLKGASRKLDISVRALYRLIAGGQLPRPLKVGRHSKLLASDVERYVQHLISKRS